MFCPIHEINIKSKINIESNVERCWLLNESLYDNLISINLKLEIKFLAMIILDILKEYM